MTRCVAGGRAFARSRREEAVAPVFVHLPIRLHVEVVGVEIHFARRRILAPREPRLHAGGVVSAVRLETGFAEGGPLVGALIGAEPDEVMVVLVVRRELHVEARINRVGSGHEPFDGVAAVVLAAFHRHLHAPAAGVRLVLGHHHAPALLVPLLHVAGFEVVREQHVRVIRDAGVAGILRGEARRRTSLRASSAAG